MFSRCFRQPSEGKTNRNRTLKTPTATSLNGSNNATFIAAGSQQQ